MSRTARRTCQDRRTPGTFSRLRWRARCLRCISLSFGYADHDPQPHQLPISLVTAPAVRGQWSAGARQRFPGGFDIVSVSSPWAATESIRAQRAAAAVIVPPQGAVTIETAGVEGAVQQQAIAAAFTRVARAMGRPAVMRDVDPLPSGDRSGLSSFVFGLGLLLPSVIGGVGLFLLGMRLRLWWRVAGAVVFAVLAASAGVLAIDSTLGALTGAGAALLGIAVLGTLSSSCSSRRFRRP